MFSGHCIPDPGEVLAVVQQLEEVQQSRRTASRVVQAKAAENEQEFGLEAKLAQLAHGLRALQRASLKLELRSVGLAVLEAERPQADSSMVAVASAACEEMKLFRSVPSTKSQPMQRVLLLSAPERVLQQRAEARSLLRKVLPNPQDGLLCGGFTLQQFDRGGPLQRFWLERRTCPYPYSPYFQAACPVLDPSALLSTAERTFLVKSFITDPKRYLRREDGRLDLRQGGAQMDPRQLLAENIIESGGLLQLHSPTALRQLDDGVVFPWKSLTFRGYLHVWLRSDTELIRQHFGPKAGRCSFQCYVAILCLCPSLGLSAYFFLPPSPLASLSAGCQLF